jgi:hypothetical protein
MMQSITRVQYNARLMGVEFAPPGQPARRVRPVARKRTTFISNRVRKNPEKSSVRVPLSALEIDQGKLTFKTFFSSISVLFSLMLATLRTAPLMLRHRNMLVSANRTAFSRGKSQPLSISQPQNQALPTGLQFDQMQFDQIRDLAMSQQSAETDDLTQIAQQFRAMRNQLGLSRRDAAQRLECSEEQILVLENGYGNLPSAQFFLQKLERMVQS